MREPIFHRRAQEDVNEIAHYIAKDNPSAASAFFDALDESCKLLNDLPEMGGSRSFNNRRLDNLRMFPIRQFKHYLIFYRQDTGDGNIEILRVVHGARDLPTLF